MSTIAPTLDAASPKRRAISPPSLKTSVEPNGPFFARRSFDVDRRGPGRGDDERDYETFTGRTRRGLHHTQLGGSTSVLSHQ